MKRAATLTLIVLVAVTAIAMVREASIGRSEMEAADRAAASADWMDAIAHARAAAEAVAPGSPWPDRARARLNSLGRDAEARGDETTALLAYGALRTAAIATRGPGSGSTPWREQADEGLARVAAANRDPSTPHTTAGAMRDALRGDERLPPAPAQLALLGAGFLSVLIGLVSVLLPR
jgi:hypothetical protein